MFSHWAYILVGSNNTGKTTFQRDLVYHLCAVRYGRLRTNRVNKITHHRAPRRMRTLFTANRSYQEKKGEYVSVENYFRKFFKGADVCVLSSHAGASSRQEIPEMIHQLRIRCYNVGGVFWSNSDPGNSRRAADLPWDDRIALQFADMILLRAQFQ